MRDTVLAALTAFFVEHQYCGELDGGREDGAIWLECSCGARTAHPATGSSTSISPTSVSPTSVSTVPT